MINVFSKEQQIVVTIATSGVSVSVNGNVERSGTAIDCMQYIRSLVTNYSFWMEKEKRIVFTVASKDISAEIAKEKSEIVNQLKRLATACKCQVVVNAGLNNMG